MTLNTLSNRAFRDLFTREQEFAVIDVRERGDFNRGHLLAASNLPLSRLELDLPWAIPRKETEIVLSDLPSAPRAVQSLDRLGYRRVRTLAGGLSGWALDGGKLFSGVNVIGKAFGEYVEKHRGTPSIGAPELKSLLESKRPPLLLDTRTPQEHEEFCIPGALNCPNGELLLRALAKLDSDTQLVVAHCAGRTRSIIGAQTLIDAGIANPVVALENGTLAWEFSGFELETGARRPLPAPGKDGLAGSRQAAERVRERFSVPAIDRPTLERWRLDTGRSLYLLDVRSAEEHELGSIPGATHVPGGQLVQNVDDYLVTRNARVVLLDTEGVRATGSAAWLLQMGYSEVYTLFATVEELGGGEGDSPTSISLAGVAPATVSQALLAGDVIALDIRSSVEYRRAHLPGAWYLSRAQLEQDLKSVPDHKPVILIADDRRYASLMTGDLERLGREVKLLEGGMRGWRQTGLPIASGLERLASEPNDVVPEGTDYEDPAVAAREGRAYLEWEIGLVHQLENDPGAPYLATGETRP